MHITTLCLLQRCLCLSLVGELVLPPEASQDFSLSLTLRTRAFNRMLAKVVHAALLPAKGAPTKDNSSAK